MSSSLPCNIPYVLSLVSKNIFAKVDFKKIKIADIVGGKPFPLPKFSILDVGFGFGKWGFLVRDTFEVMLGQNFKKSTWKINITGIEPFDKCITPIQKEVYNKIIKEDVFDVIDKLGKYDLIIMGDVIEHFDKDKAYKLLDKLLRHSDNIIISTPLGFMPQGAWAGNERETHKSGWIVKDFQKYHVAEYKIIEDDLFSGMIKSEIIKNIPNLPKDITSAKLLVLWIKK
jgi:2-polyprenyl-3-methyl-5-hydroxy-6-metoxy-1,4-benzoquinol methylase